MVESNVRELARARPELYFSKYWIYVDALEEDDPAKKRELLERLAASPRLEYSGHVERMLRDVSAEGGQAE